MTVTNPVMKCRTGSEMGTVTVDQASVLRLETVTTRLWYLSWGAASFEALRKRRSHGPLVAFVTEGLPVLIALGVTAILT